MSFNSAVFATFFIGVYALYFRFGRDKTSRLWILLIGNLVFYASWSLSFVPYLLATGAVDFVIARYIDPDSTRFGAKTKKFLLALSISINVGMLIVFKYLNFFLQIGAWIAGFWHGPAQVSPPLVDLIVPLGISFYTFQSMSYTIDVHRGLIKPEGSWLEFMASLTFFPHLLAGPIIRSSVLLPQFADPAPPTKKEQWRGLALISAGLIKKTLADQLAPAVGEIFAATHGHSTLECWIGALGYTAQIYGDFAGYTDMALGMALLLGFKLPPNFNLPYLATSPMDFWRRWHISMSYWFRDYLFFPLALGPLRGLPYLNVFLVMIIIGLWHGAGTTFVLAGIYHGVLLVATYWLAGKGWGKIIPGRALKVISTFYLVMIGQALFRSESPRAFLSIAKGLLFMTPGAPASPTQLYCLGAVLLTLVGCHFLDYVVIHKERFENKPIPIYAMATLAFAFAMILGVQPSFVYFQF